jgi:hypothetical protein
MYLYKSIGLILIIFLAKTGFTQQQNFIYDLQNDRGKVLLSNDFVAFDNEYKKPLTFYEGAAFRVLLQGDGSKSWQRSLKLPYYGIGLAARDFRSKELGRSFSAYGVLGIPILRTKPIELFTELEYGMAFGWHHYDPIDNPFNKAIGSKLTVHAAARLITKIHLSDRLDLNIGGAFVHFSNGRFERPNNGLNIATYSIGLSYQPKARINTINIPKSEREERDTEFAIFLGYGSHQRVETLDDNYFNAAGLNFSLAKRHTNLYQSRIGLDFNYLWRLSINSDGSQGKVGWNNLTLGLIYQPEVKISKFTLVGGMGVYVHHLEYKPFKQLYQRLGVRYNFTDRLSIGSNIRSVNFYQAEFLEFQLGYHF